ncbi:hypothetical protein [Arthrobacter zhaoxinii]|uniref:hypothetical protein n=1 Tax=Arthrobacter zhaoxinii TaxID=2964616 RepID=UPI00210232E2|nr:hypothetical protein [Arthrobacter zhaoxinii]MCQ1999882.1 hypothetical protein [Arthrobacter zhaoxinii]
MFMLMGLVAYSDMLSGDLGAGFLIFFHLIGALAVLTLGIMVIVQHRRRSKPIPGMLLGASAGLVFVDMILAFMGGIPGLAIVAITATLPSILLSICVLFRETEQAQ